MSTQAHLALLKNAYRRWIDTKGASADGWLAIFADEIRFGSLAQGREEANYLTAYSSREALRSYFEGIAKDWEMVDYETEHFIAEGDRVIVLGRCAWRFKRTGAVYSSPKVDTWRFAGGRAVEFFEYYDTALLRDIVSGATPNTVSWN